jgi:hypothetical protein
MTQAEPAAVDLVADDLAVARAQLDSGLPAMAEGILRRRIGQLEAEAGDPDDLDASRALLAEALWRQGRPIGAAAVAGQIRRASDARRRPMTLLVEAEGAAAAGENDVAAELMNRLVGEIGPDGVSALRGGMPSRLAWPSSSERTAGQERRGHVDGDDGPDRDSRAGARLESARAALAEGRTDAADADLALAIRLDRKLAPAALELLEPTLGELPDQSRLLLYGDLLAAAGRADAAQAAYARAAGEAD